MVTQLLLYTVIMVQQTVYHITWHTVNIQYILDLTILVYCAFIVFFFPTYFKAKFYPWIGQFLFGTELFFFLESQLKLYSKAEIFRNILSSALSL